MAKLKITHAPAVLLFIHQLMFL